MIEIINKEQCTGCTACMNICPKHSITMQFDSEGYKYPVVNKKTCVGCGACDKVCPLQKKQEFDNFKTLAFAVQSKDECVRMESTSGGAFTILAEHIIHKGGIVYGGAYDSRFDVCHQRIDTTKGLAKLRGSKYVQSDMGWIYSKVREDLKAGREVMFSGTPCQIAGLKSFIGNAAYATNLLWTVDLVCHGIPSPLFWNKFLDFHRDKHGEIKYISFRDKHYGYAGSTMAMGFSDGSIRYMNRDIQFFKKLFFDDINTRPSCFKCHFKTIKRISDFTIYDCWHVNKINKTMDDDKGTTWILLQSERSKRLFMDIKSKLHYKEAPVDKAIGLDGFFATHCTTPNPQRDNFFRDMNAMNIEMLINKYFPLTFTRKMVNMLKPLFHQLGLIKIIKRLN